MKSIFIIFLSSISAVFSSGILSDDFEHGSNVRSVRHYPDMDSTSCESVSSTCNPYDNGHVSQKSMAYQYFQDGRDLYNKGRFKEAIDSWIISANYGNDDAFFNIAILHLENPQRLPFFNPKYGYEMISWLSARGHDNSMYLKAKMDYERADNLPQNREDALVILNELSNRGHLYALEFLTNISKSHVESLHRR